MVIVVIVLEVVLQSKGSLGLLIKKFDKNRNSLVKMPNERYITL
jgi:hypothetical protein